MFDTTISYLETFEAEPMDIKLSDWIKGVKHGCSHTDKCLTYRESPSKELKQSMPMVTVGAVCRGGHAMDHVIEKTGWVALDIDDDHNPDIKDWPHVRDELAKLKNVAFAALSLSGRGVWLLVKVSDPERQSDHHRALIEDFKRLGINLDTSKGAKPNDKRFYSYDPDAVIKDTISVYAKLKPKVVTNPEPVRHVSNGSSVYDRAMKYVRNKGFTFTHESDMHHSIFHLCVFLNFKGVPQSDAESWINSNLISLSEVRSNCISDAYKRYDTNYGRGADRALERNYESRISAPHGFNPYTGEIFDERGYPEDWDTIEAPDPGSDEDIEAIRAVMADSEPDDPILEQIQEIFDTAPF